MYVYLSSDCMIVFPLISLQSIPFYHWPSPSSSILLVFTTLASCLVCPYHSVPFQTVFIFVVKGSLWTQESDNISLQPLLTHLPLKILPWPCLLCYWDKGQSFEHDLKISLRSSCPLAFPVSLCIIIRSLRSSSVPLMQHAATGHWSFAHAGSSAWSSFLILPLGLGILVFNTECKSRIFRKASD